MSGTSLDGVDGVAGRLRAAGAAAAAGPRPCQHARFRPALRAELAGAESAPATTSSIAPPSPPMRWRATTRRSCETLLHGARRRAPTRSSPSAATARPSGIARASSTASATRCSSNAPALLAELTRHRRRRRLPQPRRRRRRPGRAARAGVPSRDLRPRRRDGRGAQPRRHRQPHRARAGRRRRIGFDCGPGQHPARPLVRALVGPGLRRRRRAGPRRGDVDAALLDALLAEPYFALPPPKSTGPRPLQRGLARRAPRRGRRARAAAPGRRAGDAGRAHRPRRRRRRAAPCGRGAAS